MTQVVGFFAVLMLVAGAWSIWTQHHAFTHWESVPAVIVDQAVQRESNLLDDPALEAVAGETGVEMIRGLVNAFEGDDYTNADLLRSNVRRITYHYHAEGKTYTSSMVHLDSEASSDELFDQFPIGRTVTAWINPANTSRSYLVAKPRMGGYILVLLAMIAFSLLFAIEVVGDEHRFKLVFPTNWAPYVALWAVVGLLAAAHFAWLGGAISAGWVFGLLLYFTLISLPVTLPIVKPPLTSWIESLFGFNFTILILRDWALNCLAIAVVGFFIALLITPVLIAASSTYQAYRFHQIFEPVQARIIVSEIRKETRGRSDGASSLYQFYWPEIQFEYQVAGVTYDTGVYSKSNGLEGASGGPTDQMHAIISKFPVGSTHPARYDPKQPHIAYLAANRGGVWHFLRDTLLYLALIGFFPLVLLIVTLFQSRFGR